MRGADSLNELHRGCGHHLACSLADGLALALALPERSGVLKRENARYSVSATNLS